MKYFKINELLIIAILSAIGLAIKPVVTPLIHLISSPMMIPGGSLAGGIYMAWLVLAKLMIPKKGSSLMVGLTQALLVLFLGFFGNHGIFSILSYGLPGLMIEIICLFYNKRSLLSSIIYCIGANLVGTILLSFIIFRMAMIPLLISLCAATFSAVLGGIIAWSIFIELKKYKLVRE